MSTERLNDLDDRMTEMDSGMAAAAVCVNTLIQILIEKNVLSKEDEQRILREGQTARMVRR